jgi:hypothetical protein
VARFFWLAVFSVMLVGGAVRPAQALPIFAHQYGLSCQKCHTDIPSLNDFGRAFLSAGYRIPGATPGPAFPISTKVNLAYTSLPDPGLPKAVVDEVEFLTAGLAGSRTNYFVEQYMVDGGVHGNLREAWANYRFTPEDAKVPVFLRAGQFTLPLPVDPETFRETASHYAIFDQVVGGNTFNFFDPKLGTSLRIGSLDKGSSIEVSALNGHDQQNGLPTAGVDTMATIHHVMGPIDLSAYQYSGRRNIDPGAPADGGVGDFDRFSRLGFGLRYEYKRWTSESVIQNNTDTNVDGLGTYLRSSGGFTQLRYIITPKLYALARLDGTNDTNGFGRATTALLGYRTSHNSRVTFEDVISHQPQTTNTFNFQLTIAY